MNKIKKNLKNNVVNFPLEMTEGEREIEAIVFAAAEPLDVDTIEAKISKKVNVLKTLEKLKNFCLENHKCKSEDFKILGDICKIKSGNHSTKKSNFKEGQYLIIGGGRKPIRVSTKPKK